MLELRHVTKRYSGVAAVSDVSFVAHAGQVTGYLGPNGSGKSTTLKMIAGLIDPSEGEILFRGEPIQRDRMAHRPRSPSILRRESVNLESDLPWGARRGRFCEQS